MKMNYLLNNRRPVKKSRPIFIACLIATLLIFGLAKFFPYPFESFFSTLVKPLVTSRNWFVSNIEKQISFLNSKQSLIEERKALFLKNRELSLQLFDRDLLVKENEELKQLSGRDYKKEKTILARVLATPRSAAYDVLLVDVGKEDGLSIGKNVLVEGSFVIGRIGQVYSQTAKVILFSSPEEKTDVIIGENNALVTAVGRGGGNFEAIVSKEIEVKAGDIVSFPDIQPKVFAVVEDVAESPTNSFQTVLFKNPVNVNEILWVEVIK